MLFMLVAILFMLQVEMDSKRFEDIALLYDDMRDQLYQDLFPEFKGALPEWGAELTHGLTLRFEEPSMLFDKGEDSLKPRFIEILKDFFPRHVRILAADKYRQSIDEIQIEGHTSSSWNQSVGEDDAYFLNMALSQSRNQERLAACVDVAAGGGATALADATCGRK
jgi:outer membrane protein OmpA-like peptidoglycan-associated protein